MFDAGEADNIHRAGKRRKENNTSLLYRMADSVISLCGISLVSRTPNTTGCSGIMLGSEHS